MNSKSRSVPNRTTVSIYHIGYIRELTFLLPHFSCTFFSQSRQRKSGVDFSTVTNSGQIYSTFPGQGGFPLMEETVENLLSPFSTLS